MSAPRPLIALAGNPNTGKTTLFNHLTGSRARVGNYPGVTVERRVATMSLGPGQDADLVDIPGTYSIVGRSAEEQIAIRELTGLGGGGGRRHARRGGGRGHLGARAGHEGEAAPADGAPGGYVDARRALHRDSGRLSEPP